MEFFWQSQRDKYAPNEDMVQLSISSGFCHKVLHLIFCNLVPNHMSLTQLQKLCTQGHTYRYSKVNLTMKWSFGQGKKALSYPMPISAQLDLGAYPTRLCLKPQKYIRDLKRREIMFSFKIWWCIKDYFSAETKRTYSCCSQRAFKGVWIMQVLKCLCKVQTKNRNLRKIWSIQDCMSPIILQPDRSLVILKKFLSDNVTWQE